MTMFGVLILVAGAAFAVAAQEDRFLTEMRESMMRMHLAMDVPSTGNMDSDFVAMMVPHHQGAIDMARIELRYGHNEQLRRIAQEIIVEQQQEIIVMQHSKGVSE
jgi:uncharacterized protein (DUF305 family)